MKHPHAMIWAVVVALSASCVITWAAWALTHLPVDALARP
jgi:hypothetical protein